MLKPKFTNSTGFYKNCEKRCKIFQNFQNFSKSKLFSSSQWLSVQDS